MFRSDSCSRFHFDTNFIYPHVWRQRFYSTSIMDTHLCCVQDCGGPRRVFLHTVGKRRGASIYMQCQCRKPCALCVDEACLEFAFHHRLIFTRPLSCLQCSVDVKAVFQRRWFKLVIHRGVMYHFCPTSLHDAAFAVATSARWLVEVPLPPSLPPAVDCSSVAQTMERKYPDLSNKGFSALCWTSWYPTHF